MSNFKRFRCCICKTIYDEDLDTGKRLGCPVCDKDITQPEPEEDFKGFADAMIQIAWDGGMLDGAVAGSHIDTPWWARGA